MIDMLHGTALALRPGSGLSRVLAAALIAGGLALAGCGGGEQTPEGRSGGTGGTAGTGGTGGEPAPISVGVDGGSSKTATQTPAPTHTTTSTDEGVGPTIAFTEDFHDFGEVSDVRPVTHEFAFTNTGRAPLEIGRLKTSCGCTEAKASRELVPPGERGTIVVTYTPRGSGQHTYRVTVFSNADGNAAETQLQIRANIDPFVAIEPRKADVGVIPLHEGHRTWVTLSGHDPHLTVESLRVRNDHLTVEVVDREDVGASPTMERPGRVVLEITVDESAPWGELKATIMVTVKGTPPGSREPIEHALFVPFSASVFDEIHVEPALFRLGVIKPGEGVEQSIRVTHASGASFQVVTASIENANVEGLRVEAVPVSDGTGPGIDLLLSGDLGDHTGPVNGSVIFTTDLPADVRRKMRFSGIVR